MKTNEEMYQSLLARFEKYQAKKRKQKLVIRCTVPAAACLCLAAMGYGHRNDLRKPPETSVITDTEEAATAVQTEPAAPEISAPVSAATAEKTEQATAEVQTETTADTVTEPVTEQPETGRAETPAVTQALAGTQPAAVTQAVQTAAPTAPPVTERPVQTTPPPATEAPTQPPAARPFEPPISPVVPADPGGPGGVYSQLSVSYEEARERFGHPIVQCTRGDFTGYKAAMVSQNGDITSERAFCLEVIYNFNDGYLAVMDNERFGSASPNSDETVEYNGRTFYIGQPEDNYGQYYIGYFPSLEGGIVYQGFFADDCDIYEKMDIIISLLI